MIELGPKNVAAFICEPVVGAVSLPLINYMRFQGCRSVPRNVMAITQRLHDLNPLDQEHRVNFRIVLLTLLAGARLRPCRGWLSYSCERRL